MARIKFSPIISDISGSVGSCTFQKGEFGSILRSKPRPRLSRTNLQLTCRHYMMQLHYAWAEMSAVKRDNWHKYIAYSQTRTQYTSSIRLSGHALYLHYQFYRLLTRLSLLTVVGFYEMPVIPTVSAVYRTGANLFFSLSAAPYPLGIWFALKLSIHRPASQSFNAGGIKFIYIAPSSIAFFNITSSYTALFGLVPSVGDYIHYSIIFFHLTTPLVSLTSAGVIQVTEV